VSFVAFANISDPRLIADAILDALRLPRSPSLEPQEQVVEALSRQPTLLVLDNMEHLMRDEGLEMRDEKTPSQSSFIPHPSSLILALLERVPALKCLATSRQVLGLSGEREFCVPPLPTPTGAATPEWLVQCESVQLFVDRAQAVKPDFQVTNANASAVAELCERLEGIPLAIELAAARAVVFTPAQMLAQLEHRFNFLVSRTRAVAVAGVAGIAGARPSAQ
jgi:predicted ATPase